ncbi:MAG: hypothetical protein RMI90_04525 [Thermoguttaceae bacterium]|nr:hypothetical protein [Thermoguttaceae bacterium]
MSGTEPSAAVLAAEAQSAMEFSPKWSGACIWGGGKFGLVGGGCGQRGLQNNAQYAYGPLACVPHLSASASAGREWR